MIVTLAGHVDHGKTSLVRALTGTDTDRLAEEQRRGLTIDIGFAYLPSPAGVIGFVDVPGHHRFIHNMVAGVAARQFALLVIAADDGPMPQSREHLQILSLIGLQRGAVVLTKCDRADAEQRARARLEIDALLEGSFLAGCPVIETAALAGIGLDDVRNILVQAATAPDPTQDDRAFRLAVDRAFTLRGAGVVVTGTVHAGAVAVDDEISHFPTGRRVRVRGLHVQNAPAARARAGDRAAINLVGIDVNDLTRGDWLTTGPEPGHRHLVLDFKPTLDMPPFRRPWLPVHVYHATRHATGQLALLPNGLAELTCDAPFLARHGDRLVVRDQGLDRTIGGGRIIDNRLRPRRRNTPERLVALTALRASNPQAALDALLAEGAVDLDAFERIWGLTNEAFAALLRRPGATRRGTHLVRDDDWQAWLSALRTECEQRHSDDATLQGLQENAFEASIPKLFRNDLLRELVSARHLVQRAGRYLPARHAVQLSPPEANLLARLKPLLSVPQPPSLGDLAKTLRMPLPVLQKAVRPLAAKGMVVQINDKRLYPPELVRALADVAVLLGQNGPFTAAAFRDAANIGRNVAIDVLEYFDDRRFTRRQGDLRIVVGDPALLLPG
ncbi:MAG: selenocysteine-specific translation elongation factor [Gammaproteobacteria bacterium]